MINDDLWLLIQLSQKDAKGYNINSYDHEMTRDQKFEFRTASHNTFCPDLGVFVVFFGSRAHEQQGLGIEQAWTCLCCKS